MHFAVSGSFRHQTPIISHLLFFEPLEIQFGSYCGKQAPSGFATHTIPLFATEVADALIYVLAAALVFA
jgi:hypothetical protein